MIESIHRRSLAWVLTSSNPFAGGVTGVLLALCLWLGPVLTVNAASGGTVVAWCYNGNGQTTVPARMSEVAAIAAGGNHTVVLKSDGVVVTWGATTKDQKSGKNTRKARL